MSAPTMAFLRLELADARRSRWWAFTVAVYALLFAVFGWLGLRESSVLGFTGSSRVVLNVANAVVVAIPLVALVATTQSVVRARATGFFELFLSQPCKRGSWFTALVASRLVVLLVPLLVLLVATAIAGAVGADEDAGTAFVVARGAAVCAALVWAFTALGVLLSSIAKSAERAIVYALVAWLFVAALHDFALIGALLRWNLPPKLVFLLAGMNPVELARLGILSSVDPDLSVLGPVGFWIANSLGPTWTLVLSIAWPTVLGGVFLALARLRFRRADLT